MINLDVRTLVNKYLKDTSTDIKTFAKNCGSSVVTLQKFLSGQNLKYTTYRKYFLYVVNVVNEARKIPQFV